MFNVADGLFNVGNDLNNYRHIKVQLKKPLFVTFFVITKFYIIN